MRVVIDTNVFVSAALKDTSQPAIAVQLACQRGVLLKSDASEQQLFDVLARPYLSMLISHTYRDWLTRILSTAEVVTITERIVVCRDPTDDKFLELAVNGRADFVVSGDADLLTLHPFRGISIVRPATFVQSALR